MNIPVFKPLIDKRTINAAVKSLKIGWLGMGRSVDQFEKKIKTICNVTNKYVISVNTGYSAIHTALMVMNIGKGDEVITPAFNNIADLQSILSVGGKIVFSDVDKSLCLDPSKLEKLITKKTRAIIVCDYGMRLANHNKIKLIAKKYNLRILHDAAHSFGSMYKKKKIGSFSDITMFSFDPVKTITSIDGGAIIVNTKKERDLAHKIRLMGMGQSPNLMYKNQRAWTYDVEVHGYRYHLANVHAAIGVSQIEDFSKIKKTRINTVNYYNKNIEDNTLLEKPILKNGIVPFIYYLRIKNNLREEFMDCLSKNGIDTGIHWQPGNKFKLFKKIKNNHLIETNKIANEIVTIPLHTNMKFQDQKKITKIINNFFRSKK
jgi:dTDP-4-amino-4,6-dideoxygalactose transaminase